MTRDEAAAAFIQRMKFYVGTQEKPRGSNRSEAIDRFNALTHAPMASPWCAALVSTAGVESIGSGVWPLPVTADCDVLLSYAKKHNLLYRENPIPGDVFLLIRTSNPDDAFHTGVVASVAPYSAPGEIGTIEGNTNTDGSAEGYECILRTRKFGSDAIPKIVFVRWVNMLDNTASEKEGIPAWTVHVGTARVDGWVIDSRVWVKLRAFMEALHGKVATDHYIGYSPDFGGATWMGDALPSALLQRMQGNDTMVLARAATAWQGHNITVDAANQTITVAI